MRYVGQSFELSVPIPLEIDSISAVERGFNDVYAARYGAATGRPIEVVSYRIAAYGLSEKPALREIDAATRTLADARTGTRQTIFNGVEHELAMFDRERLPAAQVFQGPAFIEEPGSTTVVPASWAVSLDRLGCLVMRRA
jgi:N-methylhydantoinase A